MERTKMIADYMGINVAQIITTRGNTWWRTDHDGLMDMDNPSTYNPSISWEDLMPVVDAIASDGYTVNIGINNNSAICEISGMGMDVYSENDSPMEAIFEAISECIGIINKS